MVFFPILMMNTKSEVRLIYVDATSWCRIEYDGDEVELDGGIDVDDVIIDDDDDDDAYDYVDDVNVDEDVDENVELEGGCGCMDDHNDDDDDDDVDDYFDDIDDDVVEWIVSEMWSCLQHQFVQLKWYIVNDGDWWNFKLDCFISMNYTSMKLFIYSLQLFLMQSLPPISLNGTGNNMDEEYIEFIIFRCVSSSAHMYLFRRTSELLAVD